MKMHTDLVKFSLLCLWAMQCQCATSQSTQPALVYDLSHTTEHCGSRLYGISKHLHTTARFNDRNWGVGVECYTDEFGVGPYLHAGRLLNSYKCWTNVAGIGYRQPLIQSGRLGIGVGLELDYLKYCIPAHIDGKVWVPERIKEGGPAPFPLAYINWNDDMLTITMLVTKKVYLLHYTHRWSW